MQYKCRAIVLKTTKLGEADKILSLYSPEKGPIKAVAKGAIKAGSSFGVKAQVLSCCDLLLAKGRNLDIISQAKLVTDFRNIRNNYESLSIACFFVDILDTIAIEDDSYQDHYELLYKSLSELNEIDQSRNRMNSIYADDEHLTVALNYTWEMVRQLGYKPDLSRCSLTDRLKQDSQVAQYFDFRNGGITSTEAFKEYSESNPYQNDIRRIDMQTYQILKELDLEKFKREDLDDVKLAKLESSLDITVDHMKSALKLLHHHLEHRIHKEVKSWKVMEEILN